MADISDQHPIHSWEVIFDKHVDSKMFFFISVVTSLSKQPLSECFYII